MRQLVSNELRQEVRLRWDVLRARIGHLSGVGSDSPIILNSLPKSGTHLAIKLLEGLPGVRRVRFQISGMTAGLFAPGPSDETIEIGVAAPKQVSLDEVGKRLRRVPPGAFVTAHVPYSEALARLLKDLGYRMVLMIRDPRAVAVSGAAYVSSRRDHPLFDVFASMQPSERLKAMIIGIESPNGVLKDLRARVDSTCAWRFEPISTMIRFEDLVGPEGGGEQARQQHTILKVARHLDIELQESQVKEIAEGLFGGTDTFRQGQVGSWKDVFERGHREAAGPLVGDLVRELGYEVSDDWWSCPSGMGE